MNIRKLTTMAVLLALCVVGAHIKIMGSIAFDSFPAFLGALLLGPVEGAILAAAGHLISAMLAGFALSVPVHLIVAGVMALAVYAYGKVFFMFKNPIMGHIASIAVGYFFNVIFDLIVLYPLIKDVVFIIFMPLTLATLANLGLSAAVYIAVGQQLKRELSFAK